MLYHDLSISIMIYRYLSCSIYAYIRCDRPNDIDDDACVVDRWEVEVRGADGTLYAGQIFMLQFKFSQQYPMDSPEVRAFSHVATMRRTRMVVIACWIVGSIEDEA